MAADGGVFSFGDAQFHGSTGSLRLNKPVVGMAVTPDGGGYWLVASDGGIFAFGDAGFYGSTGSLRFNKPVIGMVPTHDGRGYWLVASDGGIFAYRRRRVLRLTGFDAAGQPHRRRGPLARRRWLLDARSQWHPARVRRRTERLGGLRLAPVVLHEGSDDGPHPGLLGQRICQCERKRAGLRVSEMRPYFGDVTTAVPGYTGHVVGIAVTPG